MLVFGTLVCGFGYVEVAGESVEGSLDGMGWVLCWFMRNVFVCAKELQ